MHYNKSCNVPVPTFWYALFFENFTDLLLAVLFVAVLAFLWLHRVIEGYSLVALHIFSRGVSSCCWTQALGLQAH